MKLLVLGIGNLLLTDDGVGVLAAKELAKKDWPENVVIQDGGTFTQDIFYTFGEYTHILVLDVVHGGSTPGSLYLLTEEALINDEKQRLSLHDIDLIDSLKMAELYFKRRIHMQVIGMEPENYTNWNIGLSEKCESAFPEFLKLAQDEINTLLQSEN